VLVALTPIAAGCGTPERAVGPRASRPSSAPGTSSSPTSSAAGTPGTDAPAAEALGSAGGAVPDGTTAFDDDVPGVARLDPALVAALLDATTDAADDGVGLQVTSGWRSTAYQEQLLREAIEEHGSEEEAARWVATPDASAHVSGDAVDVGSPDAAAWLAEHGARYGLCQVYDNEPWHFERWPAATDQGCPGRYPDPSHDPRAATR
jgi:hypothetical protein